MLLQILALQAPRGLSVVHASNSSCQHSVCTAFFTLYYAEPGVEKLGY